MTINTHWKVVNPGDNDMYCIYNPKQEGFLQLSGFVEGYGVEEEGIYVVWEPKPTRTGFQTLDHIESLITEEDLVEKTRVDPKEEIPYDWDEIANWMVVPVYDNEIHWIYAFRIGEVFDIGDD